MILIVINLSIVKVNFWGFVVGEVRAPRSGDGFKVLRLRFTLLRLLYRSSFLESEDCSEVGFELLVRVGCSMVSPTSWVRSLAETLNKKP